MKKITIAGIATLIIVLSSLATLQIQSLDKKTGCWQGWEYISQGEWEGYYSCSTKSSLRYQLCFDVYDSANTKNYWCEKGKINKIVEVIEKHSRVERCTPKGCSFV